MIFKTFEMFKRSSIAALSTAALLAFSIASCGDDSLEVVGTYFNATTMEYADGLDISGNHAYVTSFGNSSFTVFDITDPDDPSEITTIKDDKHLKNAKGVFISGEYAYFASGAPYTGVPGYLAIYDIAEPADPVLTGSVEDTKLAGALHVSVSGNYAFVTSPEDNRFVAVDISDPANPFIAGSIKHDTFLYKADGLFISGKYAYVTSHQLSDIAFFNIIDISDPAALSESKMASLGRAEFMGGDQPYISGSYAYVPATSSGQAQGSLSVVDISNPALPRFVSTLSDARISGADWVWLTGKYAFVSAFYAHSLTIVDVSDPGSLIIRDTLKDDVNLNNIAQVIVSGKYAYATTLNARRFTVIEIPEIYISE